METRRTNRIAAALSLLVAGALVVCAGAATFASSAAKSNNAADSVELLQPISTLSPVNGAKAGAADELPSPVAAKAHTRVIRMEVTGYCACRSCCGPNARGLTASGRPVTYNNSKFVAADTSVLPFGTRLVIPGYNQSQAVPVADRGGAIQGHKLDLFFPTHEEALQWGRKMVDVTVIVD